MITTDLELRGMTCGSCAARVEGALNQPRRRARRGELRARAGPRRARVRGVGRRSDPRGGVDGLPGLGGRSTRSVNSDDVHRRNELRSRLVGSTMLAIPVVAVSMVMGWQFDGWQWLALALTHARWWRGAAIPFHRAALRGLRHRTTRRWTRWCRSARSPPISGRRSAVVRGVGPGVLRSRRRGHGVPTGRSRYAEARAKRASGTALRSLLSLGAKDAVVLRDGDEVRVAGVAASGRRRSRGTARGACRQLTA